MTEPRLKKIAALIIAVAIVSGCATVPLDNPKKYSEVMTNTADTSLGRDVARWLQAHDGLSGFYPLSQGVVMVKMIKSTPPDVLTAIRDFMCTPNSVSGRLRGVRVYRGT